VALQIVCDHEHFVQFNLPLPDRIDEIPGLVRRLWRNHFLAGLLATEVEKTFATFPPEKTDAQSVAFRNLALDTMFFLLLKHEEDPRYQSSLCQRVRCYLILIIMMYQTHPLTHSLTLM